MFEILIYISFGVSIIVAVLMIRQLSFTAKHFKAPVYDSEPHYTDDLPSVTVCIPARNEMHALTSCLEKVIASDYQKLEIIVLDDVSGDDTSSLIKSFAHDGVRFVQGAELPEGWLGKNHALKGLLNEASGTYVLFVDVDTSLSPQAVGNMVRYALESSAKMVSVLPRREDGWRASVLFSPLRYFWEIMFHRPSNPATASSSWLIDRQLLIDRFDSFETLKTAIQPETLIAAELSKTNEYRFIMSSFEFGVGYEKKWRSQLITSTRLLFPLLNNKISLAFIALLELAILLIPSAVVISLLWSNFSLIHALAIAIMVIYAFIYGWYAFKVWKSGALIGAILWPVIVLQETMLIIASVIQYKRRSVKWKGRNILVSR